MWTLTWPLWWTKGLAPVQDAAASRGGRAARGRDEGPGQPARARGLEDGLQIHRKPGGRGRERPKAGLGLLFGEGSEVAELLEASAEAPREDREDVELREPRGASGAPTVRLVGSILRRAAGDGAPDIHLEPRGAELTVRFRADGVLREVMSVPSALQGGVARLKVLASLDIIEQRLSQDDCFSATLDDGKMDLRVSTLPTTFGEKFVLRLLDNADLRAHLRGLGFYRNMLRSYEAVFRRPYGTILVTGPTGSGKSTTLDATLGELNATEKNIVTVEDPVEYRMRGIN